MKKRIVLVVLAVMILAAALQIVTESSARVEIYGQMLDINTRSVAFSGDEITSIDELEEQLAKLPKPVQSRAIKLILQSGGIEPSALRINTAREIIASGKGKFNPCRGKFFVVRRGAAYIEYAEQHYRKHER